MKVALVIPVYNRPNYVNECFESLERLTVKPTHIIIVDDHSDAETVQVISDWCKTYKGSTLNVFRQPQNGGVKESLQVGINVAFKLGADLVINLDSDAVVKPDFVERLVNAHVGLQGVFILSGFNNPKEPIKKGISDGVLFDYGCICKAHANGINMCFNREQYEKHIKPALLAKTGNWDYMASEKSYEVAITIPSCVQHIGMVSSMGHTGADVATDFKRLSLPDVTLFGIDSHDISGINRAADICQRDIEFGNVNIITKDLFTRNGSNEQRRKDYSRFMMKELHKQFTTSHVLTIHADGYVLNWKAWHDEWLQYDYIGATWNFKDGRNVGNGGFSLRSRKLCQVLADHEIEYIHPEDEHICRTYRPALEAMGVKFAPAEVADQFSIEAYGVTFHGANAYTGQFGFHGPHVDMSMLPDDIRYKKHLPVKKR